MSDLTPSQRLILATIYNRDLEGIVRGSAPLLLAALDVAKRGATSAHLDALREAARHFDAEVWPKMAEILQELSEDAAP